MPAKTALLLTLTAVGCADRPGRRPGPANLGGGDSSVTAGDGAPPGDSAPEPEVHDPAPGVEQAGEHRTLNCPDSNQTTFQITDAGITSMLFTGTITRSVGHGTFYVRGDAGEAIGGTLETQSDGSYALHAPLFCGNQKVKLVWTNESCDLVLVYDVTIGNCTKAELRLALVWDDIGVDWELHLVKPGGRINDHATDCTWDSCQPIGADWGTPGDTSDDPHKDVDDVTAFGPESIYLPRLEGGTYTVMVEHWNSNGSPESDGRLFVITPAGVRIAEMTNLPPHHVWTAATIEGSAVTTRFHVHPCVDWSGGCNDDIP